MRKKEACVELKVRVPEVEMGWLMRWVDLRGNELRVLKMNAIASLVRQAWRKHDRKARVSEPVPGAANDVVSVESRASRVGSSRGVQDAGGSARVEEGHGVEGVEDEAGEVQDGG